ncbi:Aspercryptin biosynthesis cluster-specific transcription regulator atnN [Pseudocercospora fuligena]|uniref:Aspercryptin biosynthesis cluster-specific transcription regulator atnN n=1 Tax=Pseudocercospora fuligena TaxID=685502 RepID=A0A8H6RPY3_9PEZI|nr:Aspercryptin biosynthesis cluster-specific transcription regulator atnN [Pseudocercospora fuligena]
MSARGSSRRVVPVIRTGCLHCRSQGVVCDVQNPNCKAHLSTEWESNKTLSTRRTARRSGVADHGSSPAVLISFDWQGTYQERQSLHFFSIVSAPELAGYADILFWQESLLQSTFLDDAIKHLVAAIGAAHEYNLRRQASRSNTETDRMGAFALRQCNKSIEHLVRPVKSNDEKALLRNLTAAVLFTCFELTNEDRQAALPHVVHARRLIEQSKIVLAQKRRSDYPIDLSTIEPLVAHYEAQTGHYYGDRATPHAEFDVNKVFSIKSIVQARTSLEAALSRFQSVACQLADDLSEADYDNIILQRDNFADWFRRWDIAFSKFLAQETNTLGTSDSGTVSLLCLHQKAALLVSSIEYGEGEAVWRGFDSEFKDIVHLATEVFHLGQKRAIAYQPPEIAYFSSSMGLTEPLYLAASRSPDRSTAEKATALMRKLPLSEGAVSGWRVKVLEDFLRTLTRSRVK